MADYEQDAQPQSTSSGWRNWVHFAWLRTPIGILKIAEFVIVLLALIIMSSVDYTGSISSIEFFIFVCTSIWVFVLVVIILHILNVYHRLPAIIRSNLVMVVCCGIGALALLIASAVVVGKYSGHDTILAAGAFGLIAMFFFIFETVYYLIQFRQNGSGITTTTTTNEQTFEVPQATGDY